MGGDLQSTVEMSSVWVDFVRKVSNAPETEAEKELVSEVLKIKGVLDHKKDDQSESDVCEVLLLKLQGMDISVKALQKTDIGKTVSSFRKHKSFKIREIAIIVTRAWRVMVSKFVDDMDKEEDDQEELEKNKVKHVISANKRPVIRIKIKKVEIGSEKEGCGIKCPVTPDQQPLWNKKEYKAAKDQVKGRTISGNESIPFKHDSEKENHNGNSMAGNSIAKAPNLLKPIVKPVITSSETEKDCFEQKLEATKLKLHQNYMEAEREKKKRQIQVLELYQGVLPTKTG